MSGGDQAQAVLVGATMVAYVGLMFGIAAIAQRRISNVEDFVVAGRRLGLPLATATLLATWFGAGTLLTAADEVRDRGVTGATLDPIGAGLCLLVAGWFFAGPLWRMRLTTVPDFFNRRFGPRTELVAALLLVPSYFGWIATQFVALGGMLHLFFDIPLPLGMALVAVVGLGYTLMGGMWAVTMTDAVQLSLVVIGLLVLAGVVLAHLGDGEGLLAGLQRLGAESGPERLALVPQESLPEFLGWLGVLCAGALGNIPTQDLMQRVFASRSESVARRGCQIAGLLYLSLGAVPILLGLAAPLLVGEDDPQIATLPLLAKLFLHPAMVVLFVVTLMSVVLSTIDSALLAPSTVLAQNVLPRWRPALAVAPLRRHRLCVALVAIAALVVAYLGESAYSMLEASYELCLVSLLAPLALGLLHRRPSAAGAVTAMLAGFGSWLAHFLAGAESFLGVSAWDLPVGLCSTGLSVAAYLVVAVIAPGGGRPGRDASA